MATSHSPDTRSDGGCGSTLLGCAAFEAVIGLVGIGIGYLYQREGGKLFDNPLVEPPPLRLEGDKITVKVNSGIFTHDVIVINNSDHILTEATITATLIKRDGTKLDAKAYLEKWIPGGSTKINVTAEGTRTAGFAIAITGTAMTKTKDGRSQKVVIISAWDMKRRWE